MAEWRVGGDRRPYVVARLSPWRPWLAMCRSICTRFLHVFVQQIRPCCAVCSQRTWGGTGVGGNSSKRLPGSRCVQFAAYAWCALTWPLQPAQYEQIVKSVVMSPRNWADVVLGHLACLAALASTDVDRSLACRHQCSLLENLVIVLSDSDTDWIAPAFRMVVVESRKLAVLSGQVRANRS